MVFVDVFTKPFTILKLYLIINNITIEGTSKSFCKTINVGLCTFVPLKIWF